MTRFLAICLLVAGSTIAAMSFLGGIIWSPPKAPGSTPKPPGVVVGAAQKPTDPQQPDGSGPVEPSEDNAVVRFEPVQATGAGPQPLIIQDGRLLPVERQDVPSEHDGKLLFLATEVRPGEMVSKHKLVEFEVGMLAVAVGSWDGVPEKDRIYDAVSGKRYRRVQPTDDLAPGTTAIVRQKLRFRKLDVGDRVHAGQLLGIINPALALAEMAVKQAKMEAADADVLAAVAFKTEAIRSLAVITRLQSRGRGYATDEEYGKAQATKDRYVQEEVAKRAAVRQSQQELSGAMTTLSMHMLRASIDGVITSVYKQQGESVKNLDAVLRIQNPKRLRVEAQVEAQDALPLRDRLEKARKKRQKADDLRLDAQMRGKAIPPEVQRLEREADEMVTVQVDASRMTPPAAVLSGHLHAVTCVAVSAEKQPRIFSGSEDRTVRVWERVAGTERWQERAKLLHPAVVRSLACTPSTAKEHNLLLTGTATGRAQLFDLNNLADEKKVVMLQGRHSGSINAVAFNSDGSLCVTGGEDRSICLWDTSEAKLVGKVSSAHGQGVTSLVFTAKDQVVSAGRDKRLVVWKLVEGGLEKVDSFDRRSGDVTKLNVDPSGEHVLFDDGRELRVLSLMTRKIEGTLHNASPTATFATLALYSPDGNTILTDGNQVGRLQLWRAPSSKARGAELRQYVWSSGAITCGTFSPDGKLAITGTQDNRVLVWQMPDKNEAETTINGELTFVDEFLDTSLKKVTVRATLTNPDWIVPGSNATIVVPPLGAR